MRETDRRLRFTNVVVVVVATIAGACTTSSAPSDSSTTNEGGSNLSALVAHAAIEVVDATDSLLSRLGLARAGADDAAKPAPVTPPVPTRTPRRNRAAVVVPAPVPEPPDASPTPLEVSAPAIEPVAEPVSVELPPAVDPSIVYSQTDQNVEPPRLVSRPLPRRPPSVGSDAPTVEVVISPEGGVERVRLTSAPRRLIDVMELSAAKAWQFDPALKDGQAVRYRFELETSVPPSK